MVKKQHGLTDPSRLNPLDDKDDELIRIIIETPSGSRNKYAFDEEEKIYVLKKVLPAGMTFPYTFGFLPSTLAEDGDPMDVLVLMDEPALQGCLVKCRPIGIIEGEQGDKKTTERNDRIVAIEQNNHELAFVEHLDDLGKQFIEEVEKFFVNYHEMSGKKYRILDAKGPKAARKRIKDAIRAAKKK
jgi:inorganic pyrophosphatase